MFQASVWPCMSKKAKSIWGMWQLRSSHTHKTPPVISWYLGSTGYRYPNGHSDLTLFKSSIKWHNVYIWFPHLYDLISTVILFSPKWIQWTVALWNSHLTFWNFQGFFFPNVCLLWAEFEEKEPAETEFVQCSLFSNGTKLPWTGQERWLNG